MSTQANIRQCPNCDGYGWIDDFIEGEQDCDWCKGIGYVYRGDDSVDRPIPRSDFEQVAETLEQLEAERLRQLGYTGRAKPPWRQAIRGHDDADEQDGD